MHNFADHLVPLHPRKALIRSALVRELGGAHSCLKIVENLFSIPPPVFEQLLTGHIQLTVLPLLLNLPQIASILLNNLALDLKFCLIQFHNNLLIFLFYLAKSIVFPFLTGFLDDDQFFPLR